KSHDRADRHSFAWSSDPAEFSRIEVNVWIAQGLIQNKRAIPVSYGEAVGLGVSIDVIRGHQTSGAGHVIDNNSRASRNELAHVARDYPRVGIVTAAGGLSDDEADSFVFVKILRAGRRRSEQQEI